MDEPPTPAAVPDVVTAGSWSRTVTCMHDEQRKGYGDDRPPICPACGVTMGIRDDEGESRYVCLECGFADDGGRER